MLIERQHLSPLQIAHHKMDKSLGHLNSLVVHEHKKYFYNQFKDILRLKTEISSGGKLLD